MVESSARVWPQVRSAHHAHLRRVCMLSRVLREQGAILHAEEDIAYAVCSNVKGTRVVELRNGLYRVEYLLPLAQRK